MRNGKGLGWRLVLWAYLGCATVLAAEVFPRGSSWQYFLGLSEASTPDATAWRVVAFDDRGWSNGVTPIFYGEPLTGTQLTDMRGRYTCVFMRKTFVVKNPGDVSQLELGAVSDDGFIAWINGTPVARYNVPEGEIPFNGTALGALSEPIPFETYELDNPQRYLVAGTNVLAIQALNTSLSGSSDFVIDVSLSSSVDDVPPVVLNLVPPAFSTVRALRDIEVGFSEPVAGVEAEDLLINGTPATNVIVFAPGQYVFQFSQPPTGAVQVAWRPGHGIRDLASIPNPFTGQDWGYTLNPSAPLPGVMISEFMADNRNTVHDEDGDSPDWIELYNSSGTTASLFGWFLTHQSNNLARWRFPNISLAPRSYLVIFASGKDKRLPTGRLHTDFKLEKLGGYLALVDPATNIVSEFAGGYPPQYRDVSYGRDWLAAEVLGYFPTPTPGGPNSTGGPDFAPAVRFSSAGGTFLNAFVLALSAENTNAVIRYTLNGSAPTNTSPVYGGLITISNTVRVRARAFVPGLLPGPLRSETYLFLASGVVNFTSDLPLVVLHNLGAGNVPAGTDQFAHFAVFEPKNGRSSLTNAPDLSTGAGIHLRGSSTLGYPKSSFSVELWDEYQDQRDLELLGMPKDADWVLYAPNNFEPVLIHNPFIHELSRQIGRYSPRTRFVEVYLNKSGGVVTPANYNGIYVLMEKVRRNPERVDVAELAPEHSTPPKVTGGYILKVDRLGPGENGLYAGGLGLVYVYPKEREMDLPQRAPQVNYLRGYLDTMYSAMSGANWKDPAKGYPAYVDLDAAIDHHLLNVVAFNVDALRLSGFFYLPRQGKLTFGPLWDFDRALGSTDGRDANPRIWRSNVSDMGTDWFNPGSTFSNPWYGTMFKDLDFWQRWIDRYQELREGRFANTNLYALVDQLADQVRAAQPRERTKWGVAPRGGSYQAEVNLMKTWLSNRVDFMDTNFVKKPFFDQAGGRVSPGAQVTVGVLPRAPVYYTLDGSDPRLPGGAVSPQAQLYGGPIAVTRNVRLVARAYDSAHHNLTGANKPPLSSSWSGPTAATYYIDVAPLAITEIMYHPAPPPPGDTNEVESFAYLELKNVGQTALNLVGFQFTDGVQFVFPDSGVTTLAPGGYVLVVKNRLAFGARYPGAGPIAGEYTGSLRNAGERLRLEGPVQEPILDFRFEDHWFPITDGLGFSLVVANEQAPFESWTNRSQWRVSSRVGGSPGQADPPPPSFDPVRVNEALTHTHPPQVDAIELYNPTANRVNLGGWFLSDDFGAPNKFALPPETWIEPGGYLVIDESAFNAGGAQSFALSSLGDEVYLFSGDGTNLTGYYHGFEFGAAANGVTFGRYVLSTGEERFAPQLEPTLGRPNLGPRVGPVVINELMYNPPPNGTNNNLIDEYVELANVSGQEVKLFDPNHPTNRWRLGGGIEFGFPANASIPAGGYVLVVNFDPTGDAAALAAFRNKYGVDPGVRVLGPYQGNLENSGERVALYQPDEPQPDPGPEAGLVPYVLVDDVRYGRTAPWPSNADGTGNSLQRLFGDGYGDDPANWVAAEPTAGRLNVHADLPDTDADGLPDAWELLHGLLPSDATGANGAAGDPDGDGATNLDEYRAGTHPTMASSCLRVDAIAREGGVVVLRFTAVAGKSYSVLYCDDLFLAPWRTLTDLPASPGTRDVQVTDPEARAARFYRLVTPQRPPP